VIVPPSSSVRRFVMGTQSDASIKPSVAFRFRRELVQDAVGRFRVGLDLDGGIGHIDA
jgi:hypothetical protein